MTMQIDNSSFHRWKKDPVTLKMMEGLEDLRSQINNQLIDGAVIFESDSRIHLARLVGMREGIDTILQIEVDDVTEESNDEDTSDSA